MKTKEQIQIESRNRMRQKRMEEKMKLDDYLDLDSLLF